MVNVCLPFFFCQFHIIVLFLIKFNKLNTLYCNMKKFNEYVNEQNLTSLSMQLFESETQDNNDRKKQLEKYLKGKKYPDYIKTLNDMLDDPKAAQLLEDGFGGDLGDTKLQFEVTKVSVRNLRPTQSEIDVKKSIDFPLTIDPKNIDNYYKTGENDVIIKFPLITFRKNYVIDGHHRWSQVFAFNPDAKMVCCNYDGDISPIQMLKATQGDIAAVKADDNKNDGKIPSEKVEGQNLFDDKWDKKAIIEYIKKTAKPEVPKIFSKYHANLTDIDAVAEFVAENLMDLKSNNYPEQGAPNRGDMPQTDQGGSNKDDAKSSLPGSEGSALNKLKDGEFVKGAVK